MFYRTGAMDWMSPESVDKAFDTASDIWSLGCIILELMTCGIWDTAEMAGHLSAIKHDQAALDQLLVEVAKVNLLCILVLQQL